MNAAHNPVAIFSNGYGDHLLNLPALRALASLFPGRLTLVCQTGARDSFFHELALRSVCEVDMEIVGRGKLFDVEAVAAAVTAAGPCDLLLSLNPWHSPAVDRLIERLGRPPSIGFHEPFGVVLERDFGKHSSELAFDVPRRLDGSLRLDDFAAPPELPGRFAREAERILESLHCRERGARVLAVHTDTEERKMWPAGRFAELLDRLLDRHPDLYVLDVGEKDLGLGLLSRGRHGGRILSLCGTPLPVALLLVARSSFFLGVDSCFLHAADLWRVPGVGLFGPTDPVEWGFRFGPGRHVCGEGTLETIEVDEVLWALESLIHDGGTACAGIPAADRPEPAGKEATV